MQIGPLKSTDWPLFKSWANTEGWEISFQEERLFLNFWQQHFYVLRHHGDCCGFISAVAYKISGWVGNLLINPEKRLQGYGKTLLLHALNLLTHAGISHIWLLSNKSAQDFYIKFGFQEHDQITTWETTGRGVLPLQSSCELDDFIALNAHCWGETQRPLHHLLEVNCLPLQSGPCMALLQTGPNLWQLGPCITERIDVNAIRQLVNQACDKTPENRTLQMHVLNTAELDLPLKSSGFSATKIRTLMYLGASPPFLKNILALASNGSFG